MTYVELVRALGWRLGDRSDMGPRIEAELPVIQATVLEGKAWQPWFLEKEAVGLATVAGSREVPYPADFLGECEEGVLYLVDAEGKEILLVKSDDDLLASKLPGEGTPVAYAVGANVFRLYPKPTEVWELHLRYMGRAASLLPPTDVENPWLIHASDVVMAELGAVLAGQHLRDTEMKLNFEQAAATAWSRVYQKHVALREAGRARAMGGND